MEQAGEGEKTTGSLRAVGSHSELPRRGSGEVPPLKPTWLGRWGLTGTAVEREGRAGTVMVSSPSEEEGHARHGEPLLLQIENKGNDARLIIILAQLLVRDQF